MQLDIRITRISAEMDIRVPTVECKELTKPKGLE